MGGSNDFEFKRLEREEKLAAMSKDVEAIERKSAADPINHPPHYNHGKIEPINVIEDWGLGFCLGNCVKYIARAEHKGTPLQDLEKAAWYLNREIEKRKKE